MTKTECARADKGGPSGDDNSNGAFVDAPGDCELTATGLMTNEHEKAIGFTLNALFDLSQKKLR